MTTKLRNYAAELHRLVDLEKNPTVFNKKAAGIIEDFYTPDELYRQSLLIWGGRKVDSHTKLPLGESVARRCIVAYATTDEVMALPPSLDTSDAQQPTFSLFRVRSLARTSFHGVNGFVAVTENTDYFHEGRTGLFIPEEMTVDFTIHRLVVASNPVQ